MKKNTVIKILVSGTISLFVLELGARFVIPERHWIFKRVIFFESQANNIMVQPARDLYTFKPNTEIREIAKFKTESNKVRTEYDTTFSTDLLGLRNSPNDWFKQERKIRFFLGDSFTFAQGSNFNWVNSLNHLSNREVDTYNANLGFPGTGPQTWLKLIDWILNQSEFERFELVIPFIYDDFRRGIINFDTKCLTNIKFCDSSQALVRAPKYINDSELDQIVLDKVRVRESFDKTHVISKNLPGITYIYRTIRYGVLQKPVDLSEETFYKNALAIRKIVQLVGEDNVSFIYLPTKEEVESASINQIGAKAIKFLSEQKHEVFNCLKECYITTSDFHKLDPHMNSFGYMKIANTLKEKFGDK